MYSVLHSALVEGSVYCLLSTSFYLIFSTSRLMHFAHGAVVVVGAYTGYEVISAGGGLVAGFVSAALASAFAGALCDLCIYRPLRHRGADSTALLIASLAIFVVVQNLVAMGYGSAPVTVVDPIESRVGATGPLYLSRVEILLIAISLGWTLAMGLVMRRTRLGLYSRGTADHDQLATLTGIPVARIRTYVFFVASIAAGLVGVTRMLDTSASPSMGLSASLFAVVPFIVGGQRSLQGAAITSYAVALAGGVFSQQVGGQWSLSFMFAILAAIVLFRPQGLAPARAA